MLPITFFLGLFQAAGLEKSDRLLDVPEVTLTKKCLPVRYHDTGCTEIPAG
jgi:hypothetical protein